MHQLVPQRIIVMCRDIGNGLLCRRWLITACSVTESQHTGTDLSLQTFFPVDKASLLDFKNTALNAVPNIIIEESDPVRQKCCVAFQRLLIAWLNRGLACRPRLTVHQNFFSARQAIQCRTDLIHCLRIMQSHQIKPESIHMIFLCPVANTVDHISAIHPSLTCSIVAACGAV